VWQNQSELASSTHNICLSFRMGPSSSSLLAIRDIIYLHTHEDNILTCIQYKPVQL